MNADEVALYLEQHPEFFDAYADLLAQIFIPHPHGGRAISISERQILTLREKARTLEGKLSQLIRFGEDNDSIIEKMHRLSVAMLGVRDGASLMSAISFHLREDFGVPYAEMRFWAAGSAPDLREFGEVPESVRAFAAAMQHPYCGPNADFEAVQWFGENAPHVRSVALAAIPLKDGIGGLLVLGSPDAERFYAEMGTLYLARIAELIGAAVGRVLG